MPPESQVIVVLPAYNEEPNLGSLLEKIGRTLRQANLDFRVIVVDDGSTDGTAQLLRRLADSLPLTSLRHSPNQGLGQTIADGLRAATESAGAGDVVVTMDADGSHTPDLMLSMLAELQRGKDVVIASRFCPGARVYGLSRLRTLTGWAASLLARTLFPTDGLRDYTCGYRAYSLRSLRLAYDKYGNSFVNQRGFQCMLDILLKMRQLRLDFGEVPLVLRYDLKKGSSKMRTAATIRDTLGLLLRRRIGDYK